MTNQTKPSLPYLSDYARGKLLTEAGIKNAAGLNYHRLRNLRPNQLSTPNTVPSTTKKPVRCVETGEVFESIHACARAHNLQPSHLSAHLRGLQHAVGGRHYKYAKGKPRTPKPKDTSKQPNASTHSRKARPIKCIETGVTFRSLNSAAKTYGIPPNSIHQQLKGVYATAGGKTFEYITPNTTQLQLDKNM